MMPFDSSTASDANQCGNDRPTGRWADDQPTIWDSSAPPAEVWLRMERATGDNFRLYYYTGTDPIRLQACSPQSRIAKAIHLNVIWARGAKNG